ncbi:hypothetical protein [Paenibacillus albiflavus]|uniref:hypothetical protein n=1 Tax=Paenibacillus albiflavus TaxID=2545760 RepID=UPI0014043A4A|nr:hypothetical protein [Paenibacillus albiflavus]
MRESVTIEGDYGPIIISFGTEDPIKVMDNLHAVCAEALLDSYKNKEDVKQEEVAV